MNRLRTVFLAALLVIPAMAVQFTAPRHCCAKAAHVIKFATVAPDGSTWVNHMKALGRRLLELSDGALVLRIYAGGVAGDEIDVLRKIRIGQIHCAAFSGVGFGRILPEVRVLDLPFLFRDERETDRVHDEMFPYFHDEFRKNGFELLGWAEVGNVHIFSKRPVRTIEDFSGLKVWAWSGDPIAKATFSAMGINPIPLPVTHVTTALSTGMIDTVYAPPLGALALQWNSHVTHMTALPFVHSTGAVLISSRFFERLPGELAELLTRTVRPAMGELTRELRSRTEEALGVLSRGGITVVPAPSGPRLEEFRAIHRQVAARLTGTVYREELLKRLYGILGR